MTPDELSTALQKFEQRLEWELSEWYDKFSALHARAEKRAQRDAKRNGNGAVGVNGNSPAPALPEDSPRRVSVLAHRKPWSP